MKKVIFMALLLAMPFALAAQQVVKTNSIKHRGGAQRISSIVINGDTIYSLSLKSNNDFWGDVAVELGDRNTAIQILQFLAKYEPEKGDLIVLENSTKNIAKPTKVLGVKMYRIYEPGGTISGLIAKKQIKDFIKMLQTGKI